VPCGGQHTGNCMRTMLIVATECRRFQGFGFCEFYDMRDAEDAQEALDGKLFGGRILEVRPAHCHDCPLTASFPCASCFDRNLPQRGR
jgi:RNA recognition motif-containing protein